jgi:hypothetical protein
MLCHVPLLFHGIPRKVGRGLKVDASSTLQTQRKNRQPQILLEHVAARGVVHVMNNKFVIMQNKPLLVLSYPTMILR